MGLAQRDSSRISSCRIRRSAKDPEVLVMCYETGTPNV